MYHQRKRVVVAAPFVLILSSSASAADSLTLEVSEQIRSSMDSQIALLQTSVKPAMLHVALGQT